MAILSYAALAVLLVAVVWAALQLDRVQDFVVLRTAGALNRKAGIVAASLFIALVCGATLWSSF